MSNRKAVLVGALFALVVLAFLALPSLEAYQERTTAKNLLSHAKYHFADSVAHLGRADALRIEIHVPKSFYVKNIKRLAKYNPSFAVVPPTNPARAGYTKVEFIHARLAVGLSVKQAVEKLESDLRKKNYRLLGFEELVALADQYPALQDEWDGMPSIGTILPPEEPAGDNPYWRTYFMPMLTYEQHFSDDPPPHRQFMVKFLYTAQGGSDGWTDARVSEYFDDLPYLLAVTTIGK